MTDDFQQSADSDDTWSNARHRILQLEHSTQRISSRWFLGNAGVIAAAVLFLASALTLSLLVARMLDNTAKAEQAHAIQQKIGDLQDGLAESSGAARAYALTHNKALLQERTRANGAVAAHLVALDRLMAKDAGSAGLLASLHIQVAHRISLYNAFVTGGPDHLTVSEADRLKAIRANNGLISALRGRASKSFAQHQDYVIADVHIAIVLALLTGITAPLFGLVGLYLLRRERESQQTRQLQLELIHVQRLAVMGQTSAMLAHEINQPLSAATNYISVARRLLENQDAGKAGAVLERIAQQIQRAAAIVLKLRRFIEKRESERSLEAPNVLVEDAITLLGTLDGSIELKTSIAPDLPRVLVDRVQVQQVLVNLMRNAIEAMQGSSRRELCLAMNYTDGSEVLVTLTDTGPGLSPEVAERLFQPFVSTKSGGMGIGLSICQSIIAQHGGRIWAETNPQGGTIFRFTLPVVAARAAA